MVDHLVRKTIVFCEQKRPEMAGIEAEQFHEPLVHEFRRQCAKLSLQWPVYAMGSRSVARSPHSSDLYALYIIRSWHPDFHRAFAHVIKSDTSRMVKANSTMSGIKQPKNRNIMAFPVNLAKSTVGSRRAAQRNKFRSTKGIACHCPEFRPWYTGGFQSKPPSRTLPASESRSME